MSHKKAILVIAVFIYAAIAINSVNVAYADEQNPAKNPNPPDRSVNYIGIVPYFSPDKIWHFFQPVISYLNRASDIRWELKLYHSHDSIINGICNGELSIAYLSPVHFAIAYKKCGIKPLLITLAEDGKPYFRSAIITSDPGIKSLKELKGKRFAFGPKSTTGAYVVPRKMLEDEGITMDMIKPVFFAGGDKIVNAVARKEVAAGAVRIGVTMIVKGFDIKTLKVSEPLLNFAFCAAPDASQDAGRKFIDALLRLKPLSNKDDSRIVKNWYREMRHGFVAPPESYVRDALELYSIYRRYEQ